MVVVRSVRPGDVDALIALASQAGSGLTTLKPDRAALTARIDRVQRTVRDIAPLAERGYLFVMEDLGTQRVIGVCGLEVAVGLIQPFYNYRVSTVVHASRELDVWTKMRLLNLSHDLTGYAELCSLFLDPTARVKGNGALLSKSRFMFLAAFPDRFPERICAELRGHFDDAGRSPLWDAVGSHFFQIGFDEADYLSSHGKKSFVAELMPRYPVYVDLLPEAAQEAVGKTHRDTMPARVLLEAEGMRFENHVDIFDGGPVLESHVDTTRAVRESRRCGVDIVSAPPADTVRHLVSNQSLHDFRVISVGRKPVKGVLALTRQEADALGVAAGAQVRTLPLYPKDKPA
jgi:arginine N-succinyltransferase